jgi:hypothetical protein
MRSHSTLLPNSCEIRNNIAAPTSTFPCSTVDKKL